MQVEAGAPLVRIATSDTGQEPRRGGAVDFTGLRRCRAAPATLTLRAGVRALRSYLLGYDLDPGSVQAMLTRQRRLGEIAAPADTDLLRCEDSLLDLFADVGSLYRPRGEIEPEEALVAGSTQEYLLSYLQWLDADRAGLPDSYRRRLERALLRYGVHGLDRTPELEEAVVWMFRSFRRVADLVASGDRDPRAPAPPPSRAGAGWPTPRCGPGLTGWRPSRAASGWSPTWPATCGSTTSTSRCSQSTVADEYARVQRDLDALRDDPDGADRAEPDRPPGRLPAAAARRVAAAVARQHATPALRRALLEVYTPPVLPDQATSRLGGQRA